MKLLAIVLVSAVAALGFAPSSCKHRVDPVRKIAYAGHGKLFDKKFKEVKPDAPLVLALQGAMLNEVMKAAPRLLPQLADKDAALGKAQGMLLSRQLPPDEQILITAGVIDRLLRESSRELTDKYAWRNRVLVSHYLNLRRDVLARLRPEVMQALRDIGFIVVGPVATTTDYIEECRAQGVPIPPDWAETGTDWVMQGTLTQNLLVPGDYAAVWTYSDPSVRGACIALPRGGGDPGSAAGIICQSATTGHACFWDNKLRDVSPEVFLGWRGRRLVISELKDGSNLDSACTGCHRGNNVFLISPDDPTWARVLRGPLNGVSTGTFTTRVEGSTDNTGGHPRYIPITTAPPRAGWQNQFQAGGCSTSCHEAPTVSGSLRMPPLCATGSDPSTCYGTP